jgi:hypothetical protein
VADRADEAGITDGHALEGLRDADLPQVGRRLRGARLAQLRGVDAQDLAAGGGEAAHEVGHHLGVHARHGPPEGAGHVGQGHPVARARSGDQGKRSQEVRGGAGARVDPGRVPGVERVVAPGGKVRFPGPPVRKLRQHVSEGGIRRADGEVGPVERLQVQEDGGVLWPGRKRPTGGQAEEKTQEHSALQSGVWCHVRSSVYREALASGNAHSTTRGSPRAANSHNRETLASPSRTGLRDRIVGTITFSTLARGRGRRHGVLTTLFLVA